MKKLYTFIFYNFNNLAQNMVSLKFFIIQVGINNIIKKIYRLENNAQLVQLTINFLKIRAQLYYLKTIKNNKNNKN